MSTLRPVGPVAFENSREQTAPKNRLKETGRTALSGVKEKTHQPLTTPRKALNPLQNTYRQSQQVTSQAKPTVSITTKPSAQKPSQQNIKSSKKASKAKPAPTNPEHDNKEEYPEIENIHITDPLKMELEDLPYTTPDYIFNLKSWMPRLYSCHRKGPHSKDDNNSWNDYSYEPVEAVNPPTTNDGEDWSLPFDVPPVPDIPDLDIL